MLEAGGESPGKLGNRTLIGEALYEMWTFTWLEALGRDLRYAARILCSQPGFTAAAVLSLALGIGANTALFQLLDALVLRALPSAQSAKSRPAHL